MSYVTLDSRVNDPMIARRLAILETATANQDAFEPQPPLTMWQVRRVSALQDAWLDYAALAGTPASVPITAVQGRAH
jgi:hypothetical protein